MRQKTPQPHTLTVGELCAAIADGRLPATLHDNQWYQITARELRHFVNRQQEYPKYPALHRPRPAKPCSAKS